MFASLDAPIRQAAAQRSRLLDNALATDSWPAVAEQLDTPVDPDVLEAWLVRDRAQNQGVIYAIVDRILTDLDTASDEAFEAGQRVLQKALDVGFEANVTQGISAGTALTDALEFADDTARLAPRFTQLAHQLLRGGLPWGHPDGWGVRLQAFPEVAIDPVLQGA